MHHLTNTSGVQDTSVRHNVVMWFVITLSILFFLFTMLAVFVAERHIGKLTVTTGIMMVNIRAVSLLLICIFLVYALFLWRGKKYIFEKNGWRWILIGFSFFVLILLISPPFLSADMYGYILRSIITTTHEINPYQIAPADLGYSNIIIWPEQVMRYGPLYALYSLGLTQAAGDTIASNILVYRIMNVVWLALSAWLLYRILLVRSVAAARIGTAFFLWNPFILFETVHSGHNDIMLLTAVLGSIFLIQQQRYLYAIWALCLGALIKYSLVALIPFVLMLMYYQTITLSKKMVTTIIAILGGVGLLVITYLPFGGWSSNVTNLREAFYGFEFMTLPKAAVFSLTHHVAQWFSFDSSQLGWMTRNAYVAVFIVIWLLALFLPGLARRFDRLPKRFFWTLLMLVMLLSIKLNIWYLVWILPLTLLVDEKKYVWYFTLLTGFCLLFYNEIGVFIVTTLLWISLAGVNLFFLFQLSTRDELKHSSPI